MEYDHGQDVSAFEAKTHLSELLRETEQGKSFVIRRRGKAVARLIPLAKETRRRNFREVLAGFRKLRKSIPGTFKLKEMIEEGRRY
ncbi:MAG: type II toxin-antitoxin system prevent-host-death family antitoxin [Chlamydiae bacterium]|nr:type II toxin-antitoxin system prevent-host-death family antitoxin [Chlamydiota bacterium]MBI3276665.1 type II toxin-antitoxin system prevent-host-death family antitoxin [Chlamydiota bacterium]